MSSINGDKSRHQINRKRGVHRREKIRQLLEAHKAKKEDAGKTEKTSARK